MLLKHEIYQNAPMKIADFMSILNKHAKLGYYTTKENIIGSKGDFVTSPEISQMFGECIGIHIANSYQNRRFNIINFIELGPGKGTLATDVLRTLKQLPGFCKAKYKYVSIDKNPYFRHVQKERISKYVDCFESYCEVDHVPPFDNEMCNPLNVFLAHEFFDALPTSLYYQEKSKFFEIKVDTNESKGLTLKKFPIYNVRQLDDYIRLNSNDRIFMEYSDDVRKHVLWINSKVHESKGASVGVIIDYGYDRPSPFSLRAILKHRFVGLFDHMGEADYSVNVDFKLMRLIFETGKQLSSNLSTQARFLIDNGIYERMDLLGRTNPASLESFRQDVHRLLSPIEMGQIYKVLTFKSKSQ